MNFSKIEWPTCPECLTVINDERIFDLRDVQHPNGHFRVKTCLNPKCGKVFLLATKIELTCEAVPISDY